eukprot:gene2372-2604_t
MAKKTLFFGPLILWVCLSLIITHAWQGLPSRMYARHVNTAQLYAKKGGGGGGGGGGGYSPGARVPKAAEVTLKEQILAEASQSEERIQALSSLQAQIARSMARKNEIESTMATEIDQLRQSFFQEVLREKERLIQLESLHETCIQTLLSKRLVLTSEQDVLQQMKEISQKIIEKTVLDQLEGAIAKKASLIEIEEEVYREIDQCAIEVNQEISATKTKIMSLETVVRSLPEAGVDRIVYRSYSWQEVEQTQKALADYLIASSGREETIRALVSTMDRLLRRKGLVLGVNTVLPDDVAAAMPKRKQSVKEMNEEESRIYQPHIVKKYRKEEEEEGEEEEKENVPAMAIEGLKETTFSIGDVTSSLVDATGAFWTSEEGELSRQSFTSAVSSAQKVGSNIQAAWEAMKTSWESHSNDTSSIETTDQFFSKWVEAVKDVWTNRAAQEAWKEASKNSRESLVAAAKASQLTLDTISDELQQSEQWQNALGRFGSGLAKIVAAVVKGVEGLFVVDSLDRRLPSPKDPKGL